LDAGLSEAPQAFSPREQTLWIVSWHPADDVTPDSAADLRRDDGTHASPDAFPERETGPGAVVG